MKRDKKKGSRWEKGGQGGGQKRSSQGGGGGRSFYETWDKKILNVPKRGGEKKGRNTFNEISLGRAKEGTEGKKGREKFVARVGEGKRVLNFTWSCPGTFKLDRIIENG